MRAKVAFFSVVLNNHQICIADELYEQTNHNFVFIEMIPLSDRDSKGGGLDYSNRPYLIQAWKDDKNKKKAYDIAISAEVAIFSNYIAFYYQKERLKRKLLTFEVGERCMKRGWINLFSTRLLKEMWYYYTSWKYKPLYKLCASAFAASDYKRLGMFSGKCYKWGYFVKTSTMFSEVETPILGASTSESTPLMWCARFLRWKHPEIPIMLAERLKKRNLNFTIDMFGNGTELGNTKQLAHKLDVEDVVSFRGNYPNDTILKEMKRHKIFIFTSDFHEGWGVVANEAMGCGCVLIGSDTIGSVPFLIKEGWNGLIFKTNDINDLEKKVVDLIEDSEKLKSISNAGIDTIRNIWSPRNAVSNFLKLANCLNENSNPLIKEGPCSPAN